MVSNMWRTPNGDKTFSGPIALLFAESIQSLADYIYDSLEFNDDFAVGIPTFDNLTTEQKIWSLHKVAFGFLCDKTSACSLTAYLEATAAGIFTQIETQIQSEIAVSQIDKFEPCYFWRQLVFDVHGQNRPEFLDEDEKPLFVECDDMDQWQDAISYVENEIFWDDDYLHDEFNDFPPEISQEIRRRLAIADDYYSAVPVDPHLSDARELYSELSDFCNKITKLERKK